MNKQKGLAPTLIILLIAVAVGGYFIYANYLNTPTRVTQQNTKFSPAPTNETAIWKIYTNKKFGIEFKYPKELFVWNDPRENPNNENGFYLNQDDCENTQAAYCGVTNSLSFYTKPANNLTLAEWIEANLFKKSNITKTSSGGYVDDGEYCYSRAKQEKITIAQSEAIAYSFSWDQLGHPGQCLLNKSYNANYPEIVKEIYFTNKGYVYIFDLRYKKGSDLENKFNQILSTVKFTN